MLSIFFAEAIVYPNSLLQLRGGGQCKSTKRYLEFRVFTGSRRFWNERY